ncbi:MAG: SDR family oxidoreductase [Planctomycetales bacterium]|nr:SDR family oxidoreductase [Planctomycetales bacterium]
MSPDPRLRMSTTGNGSRQSVSNAEPVTAIYAPFSLTGQTALITGGGTGLGLGIARAFVAAGARVAIVGRRSEVLEHAAAELGDQATWEAQDINRHDELPSLVGRIEERLGPLSILVNNAGIHRKKLAVDTSVNEFAEVIETNLISAFALVQAALPGMIERADGNVLFIASMASLIGIPQVAAYSAAKAGHLGLVRSLAAEVSPHGVRVNAVAPGWIESDMLRRAMQGDPARADKVLGRTPLNRFGNAQDIGWAATYLCSPAARFVTGVVLPVDGGASIGF